MAHNQEFSQALIKALRKSQKKAKPSTDLNIPTFQQEVVISVPNSFVETNKNGARDFIKRAGEINRTTSFHLPIKLEQEAFTNMNGEKDVMLNIVAKYGQETDIEALEEFLADA